MQDDQNPSLPAEYGKVPPMGPTAGRKAQGVSRVSISRIRKEDQIKTSRIEELSLGEAIERFQLYLAGTKNRSRATVLLYGQELDRFAKFLAGKVPLASGIRRRPSLLTPGDPVTAITLHHVEVYTTHLHLLNRSSATRQRILSTLRSFFSYLEKYGYPVLSPGQVELPKVGHRTPNPDPALGYLMSEKPVRFTSSWQELIWKRNQAIILTLRSTMMRVSELVSLDRSMIDWHHSKALIVGKGNKERQVFFSPEALAAISIYLDTRGEDGFEPLFIHHDRARGKRDARAAEARAAETVQRNPSRTARNKMTAEHCTSALRLDPAEMGEVRRLSRSMIEKMVKREAHQAGIKATPHHLRHYGATAMLANGANMRVLQELLGHAHMSTTEQYTHIYQPQLEKAWQQYHPDARPNGGDPGSEQKE